MELLLLVLVLVLMGLRVVELVVSMCKGGCGVLVLITFFFCWVCFYPFIIHFGILHLLGLWFGNIELALVRSGGDL